MRLAIALCLLAACAQNPVYTRAHERLGGAWKRIHVYGPDRSDDGHDIYMFCRDEHRTGWGVQRAFDAACVVYVCAADSGSCTES